MSRAERVLIGLASLQKDGLLCDVQLQVGGQQLSAHRAVLAAASPYFHAMFSGGFKETKSNIVQMQEISFDGLKAIVDCIYTTKIKPTSENISDILPAAHLMQMDDIFTECKEWMPEKITKMNCFPFLKLAEKYGLEEVETAIHKFIMQNFVAVSKTEDFKDISQAALCKFLSSDMLCTGLKEIHVYEAAKVWIEYHGVTDKQIVFDIMKNVRFALLAPVEILGLFDEKMVFDNHDYKVMVKEACTYHSNIYTQPLYDGLLNRSRGKPRVMIIPSGKLANGYNVAGNGGDEYFLDFPNFQKKTMSAVLKTPIVLESMKGVQVNNFVFLFGADCRGYQNFTKRYDATNDTWLSLTGAPCKAKIGTSVARLDDKIFFIGGMFVGEKDEFRFIIDNITDESYVYSISSNDWKRIENLPVETVGSGACSYQNFVYVSGGYVKGRLPLDERTSDQLCVYDVKAKSWLKKKSMNHARCHHLMVAINENLYVLGGRAVTFSFPAKYVEMYNITADQWTDIYEPFAAISGSSFVVGNQLYVTGGNSVGHSKQIAVFDPKEKRVVTLSKTLPEVCDRHVAAYVTSPKLL